LVLVFVNEFVIFSFFAIFVFVFVNENHTAHLSSSEVHFSSNARETAPLPPLGAATASAYSAVVRLPATAAFLLQCNICLAIYTKSHWHGTKQDRLSTESAYCGLVRRVYPVFAAVTLRRKSRNMTMNCVVPDYLHTHFVDIYMRGRSSLVGLI